MTTWVKPVFIACLAAVHSHAAGPASVDVILVADKSSLEVGETAMVTVSAQIKEALRPDTLQIFSWYLDLINSDGSVVDVLGEIHKPASDQDERTASAGVIEGSHRAGIFDTFIEEPGAGHRDPVILFEVPVRAMAIGSATLSVRAGTGLPNLFVDFLVAQRTSNDPLTGGDYSLASLVIDVRSPNTRIIELSGSLDFGDVAVGQAQTRPMTLRNLGNDELTVTQILFPEGFSGDWMAGVIEPNEAQTVNVTFAPDVERSYDGVVEVDSNATDGGNTIPVSGNGIRDTGGPIALFSETFDDLDFGPNVDETLAGEAVWTKQTPAGWTIDDSGVESVGVQGVGVTEWEGWSFAQRTWWQDVGGQRREEFLKGVGGIAVADGDEWDDIGNPVSLGLMDTLLSTPAIDISKVSGDVMTLTFDSSWRPYDQQTATVSAVFDGGEPVEVLRWESNPSSDQFKPEAINESVSETVTIPPNGQFVVLTFGYLLAGNDWWWAIDNVRLLVDGLEDPPEPTELRIVGIRIAAGGIPTVRFAADPDHEYVLWRGEGVDAIDSPVARVAGVAGELELQDPAGLSGRAFYRVQRVANDELRESEGDAMAQSDVLDPLIATETPFGAAAPPPRKRPKESLTFRWR